MPSPVSDESSSTERRAGLREFVDQAIAQDRLAAMSPRSALLSQSSLQTPTEKQRSSDLMSGVVDSGRQLRKRNTGSRRKRGLEVARPSALTQLLDVDISRKDPKDEVMRLREILKTVERHSISESRRAVELERANQEAQQRVQLLAENRLIAQQEAAKAHQEVRIVQLQLENAQREIERKQDEVKRIEQQRDEAEAEAVRARAKARKLHQEKIAAAAREEGRRLGFQAGFDYAKKERQIVAARKSSNAVRPTLIEAPRPNVAQTRPSNRIDKGKQRAYDEDVDDDDDATYRRRSRSRQQVPPTIKAPSAIARAPPIDDILSSPDDEMSLSELPLRGLPPVDYPAERTSMQAGPSQSTPLRPFAPPPETDSESEEIIPPPNANAPPPPRTKTPAIQIYQIDIPSARQLNRQYNTSQENPNAAIPQLPRDQWVTASSFHQIRGPPPQFPGRYPPPLLPPARRPAPNPQNPSKAVKFPKLSRPSLAKTKEQATSWYRSLSFRKKNKPVIDPIPEETSTTPISAGPVTGSTINEDSQPPTATEPPNTNESQELYGASAQPTASWYQPKQRSVPPSAPPSVRSGYSRMRPISDASVSTRVSQFDILATPHAPAAAAMSVRSGKEGGRKVKEKDSYLSVIKEDPSSRGNTPERYVPGGSMPRSSSDNMRSAVPQPNFGQRSLQQQSSYGTIDSSAQNKRRSRRPPTIEVPEPDQELEPFGVAYNRGAAANGYQPYPPAGLNRRPSRISEKSSPNTSIGIDVVPPSGIAPDVVHSPPHTGRNHLSPYHTYQPAPSFTQSVTSLQSQGGTRTGRPPAERPPSAADSRRRSKQSLNGYADPNEEYYQATPSMTNVQPRPPSTSSRPRSGMNNPYTNPDPSYNDLDRSRTPNRTSQYQGRPESVRSSASKRPLQQYASQTSLLPGGGVQAQPTNASSSRLVLASPVHRVASNASMRSQGSYGKYDPSGYVDPAFWPADGPPPPAAVQPQMEGYFDRAVPPRPPSANSALSYMSVPRR
ncbi:hypothetical protein BDZ97DRAFT_1924703 [Flammula alnicola]|nr:hypothetical protein BDZ97DRAFT_1924703 [Flammula alnicola]